MKFILSIFSFLFIVCLLSGCAANPTPLVNSPADVQPTQPPAAATIPAPSATPEPVTLDNICSHTGETAALQGILRLPEAVTCSVGLAPNWCSARLYDPYTDKSIRVDLYVSDSPETTPDRMAALPKPYAYSNLKVGTDDGGLVGHGSLVSLSGKIAAARSGGMNDVACKLSDVQKVMALPQLIPVGMEVQKAKLVDAVAGGLVAASARGKGLERIDLTVKSQVDYNLEVSIQAGTIFEALSGEIQNMVVRQGSLVVLRPQAEVTIEVEVACANMQKKEPGRSDAFKVGLFLAGEDLLKLLALPEFQFVPIRLRQFAVWTITDNPARDYYVGVSTTRGISEGPSAEEFAQMKDLFARAGIDTGEYNAFK